ncbi:MAG: virulence RhuM family protein [Acholeplasmatales bacterium]|nr:virulence RhuM family protein [Acholeplasmatales bacterium]
MNNKENKYDLIKFEDGNFSLDVNVSPNEDTLWLKQDQIALLFGKAKSTINKHIRNILKNELDETQVMRKFGKAELSNIVTKPIYYYNLNMILAIGYRVNSKNGIEFRRWANRILK